MMRSGRARYAAAMAQYGDGRLTAGALEVYRICSSRDHQNPAPLLAEAGQAPPDPTAKPVLAAQLPAALTQLRASHPTLAAAIATAAPHLNWITCDLYDPAQIGAFADNHCYASLLGRDATIPATDFDLGLVLIAPQTLYRDHHHAAPELYATLSRDILDAAVPDRPCLIYDGNFHNACLNSCAIQIIGLTDTTPDPLNGHIVRDASGRATGAAARPSTPNNA